MKFTSTNLTPKNNPQTLRINKTLRRLDRRDGEHGLETFAAGTVIENTYMSGYQQVFVINGRKFADI